MRFFSGLVLIALTLSGCASLTQEQCQTGNWRDIGQADAVSGFPASRFQEHGKACERYGITPSIEDYQAGYHHGLLRYCTLSNGFTIGRQGYTYQGICPAILEPAFSSGYQRGSNIHEIEMSIASARRAYSEADDQLVDGLKSDDKPSGEEILRLRDEKSRLLDEIRRLTERRERALVEAERFLVSKEQDL